MKAKATLLVGAAIGYVLGARAGRQRYEKIKARGQDLWQHPKVQEQVGHAQALAREKAPDVQQKLAEATSRVTAVVGDKLGDKLGEKLHADDDPAPAVPGTPPGAHRSA